MQSVPGPRNAGRVVQSAGGVKRRASTDDDAGASRNGARRAAVRGSPFRSVPIAIVSGSSTAPTSLARGGPSRILRAATVAALLADLPAGWTWAPLVTASLTALAATAELVFGLARAARCHDSLAVSFLGLEKDLLRGGLSLTPEALAELQSRRLDIEASEPPCLPSARCDLSRRAGDGALARSVPAEQRDSLAALVAARRRCRRPAAQETRGMTALGRLSVRGSPMRTERLDPHVFSYSYS